MFRSLTQINKDLDKNIFANNTIGDLSNPLVHIPLKNTLDMVCGKGTVTFARGSAATYIDRYGAVQKVGNNVARFEADGLLMEGRSTNKLTYSEAFDKEAWGKWNLVLANNSTTAPDGTNTADGLIREDGFDTDGLNMVAPSTSTTLSLSAFYKAGDKDFARVLLHFRDSSDNNIGTSAVILSLLTGEYNIYTSDDTTTIVQSKFLANGWVRVELTITYTGTGTSVKVLSLFSSAQSLEEFHFIGDGSTINTYVWGAQLEELPYCTSYIPTTEAAATRAGDACYISALENIPQNTSPFSVLIDYISDMYSTQYIMTASGDAVSLYTNSNNDASAWVGGEGSGYFTPLKNTLTRLGISCNGTSFSFYLGGEKKSTTTKGSEVIDLSSPIYLGCYSGNTDYNFYGHISNFRIYDRALTDEEMRIA